MGGMGRVLQVGEWSPTWGEAAKLGRSGQTEGLGLGCRSHRLAWPFLFLWCWGWNPGSSPEHIPGLFGIFNVETVPQEVLGWAVSNFLVLF